MLVHIGTARTHALAEIDGKKVVLVPVLCGLSPCGGIRVAVLGYVKRMARCIRGRRRGSPVRPLCVLFFPFLSLSLFPVHLSVM